MLYRIPFIILTLCCGLMASCQGNVKSGQPCHSILKTDSCVANSHHSYEIYLPVRTASDQKLPLLIIVDAHGAGKFALQKFKKAADKFQVALVASNWLKNGCADYESAIAALVADVQARYPVSTSVFLAGFSGGARMVLAYAQHQTVDGVIACGALMGPTDLAQIHCPVMAISGLDDFNFVESAQYLFQQAAMPPQLKIELTEGSHSWPDSVMLANAVGFLRLTTSTDRIKPPHQQVLAYQHEQERRINSYKLKGDYLNAFLIAHNLSGNSKLDSSSTFAAISAQLQADPHYIQIMTELAASLNEEMGQRNPYLTAFSTREVQWWKREIEKNRQQFKTEINPYKRAMYARIKGFWGIACYSLSNQYIQQHNISELRKIVQVYQLLEPENPTAYYNAAFVPYWQGDKETTQQLLKKACQHGFTNLHQLQQDFPEIRL